MPDLKSFVSKSEDVTRTLLEVLNAKLELPPGSLASCHLTNEKSLCEVTLIRNPGQDKPPSRLDDDLAVGEHTDFGSIVRSLLHRQHIH